MRTTACLSGLLGGLAWLVAAVLDRAGVDAGTTGAMWIGGLLLAVATLATGACVVSRSAAWLRAVVALCTLALAASVLELLRGAGDPRTVDAVVGVVVAIAAVVVLRRPGAAVETPVSTPPGRRRARGTHAR